jgi:hypothetical protein
LGAALFKDVKGTNSNYVEISDTESDETIINEPQYVIDK